VANNQAVRKLSSVEFVTIPIGQPTRNNRIYPKELMERELKKYQEQIEQRKAFVTTYSEGCQVFLKDVVGLVNEAVIKDDKLVIKMEVLDTLAATQLLGPDGQLHATLFNVAPFGMGSLKENVVQDDFKLVGFHIDPNYERRNED